MRSFDASGLFCCGRKRDFLCLNFSASGRVLALGLGVGLGLGLVIPQAAQAACVATPDCDALGYTASSCASGGVKCPWDTSKFFCGCGDDFVYSCIGTGYSGGVGGACGGKYASCTCAEGYSWGGESCCENTYQYTCTGSNEAGGSGTACGSKYASCACDAGYEWSGSACSKICAVGDILNSDKTCTSDKVSGKTPIGVVSYINGSSRLAIQLNHMEYMEWSSSTTDISGIPNYTDSTLVLNDFNGKSNTTYAVAANSSTSYAPGYCNAYSTTGTSPGDWYLPALGELRASVGTNKSSVNAGLSKAGGSAIVNSGHWSSSEFDDRNAWLVAPLKGVPYKDYKNYDFVYVRCVLAF